MCFDLKVQENGAFGRFLARNEESKAEKATIRGRFHSVLSSLSWWPFQVQECISIWLRWLRLQVGFDGWRFDFVKGYGAEFVGLSTSLPPFEALSA